MIGVTGTACLIGLVCLYFHVYYVLPITLGFEISLTAIGSKVVIKNLLQCAGCMPVDAAFQNVGGITFELNKLSALYVVTFLLALGTFIVSIIYVAKEPAKQARVNNNFDTSMIVLVGVSQAFNLVYRVLFYTTVREID